MRPYDGAVATHSLLGQLLRMLLEKKILSIEDVRSLLDTALTRIEASQLDADSLHDARKLLEGDLQQGFQKPPEQ